MPDPVSLRNVMANSFINESHLSSKANVNESAQSVLAEHMIKKQEEKKEQVQKTEETEDKLIKDEHSEDKKHKQNLSSSSKESDSKQKQDENNTNSEHFIDFVI
jgi:hypothetical protein